jgi:CubicO group peptidase (beta-lactamase class C family)
MLLNSFGTELIDLEGRLQYYGYHATKSSVILEGGTVVTTYGHPGGSVGWDGNFVSKLAYSPELDLSVSVLTNSPLNSHGACPDHSADQSQRLGPQLCVIQEIFAAYASDAESG